MLAQAKYDTRTVSDALWRLFPEAGVSCQFMPELRTCDDASAWDAFVSQARDASVLQAWAWGSLKARYGWSVQRYFWIEGETAIGAAAVLRRSLPGGLALNYAPRGPILNGRLDQWPTFWQALRERLAQAGGTVLKVDPEWTTDEERAALTGSGALPSRHPIQHQATMVVDISGGDEAMMRLKESTRRNIRAGIKQGIRVDASESSAAMDSFYDLLQETAAREQFTIRRRAYYQDLLSLFRERGQVAVYLARHEDRLLAGAVMLFFGSRLIYLYGGTRGDAKDMKPGYLLHWRAIEDAQRRGCATYDMWGVPIDPQPGQRGYYVFKSRFNGRMVRFIGLYDLPVNRAATLTIRLAERFARAGQPEFV
jgi:lipid II:glycine glycyltransferase (peptidoglycan interpeptide bridge formation enzyme)